MRVVVTGANRGLGLEMARQYLARGDTVHAGARDPARAADLAALGAAAPGRLHVHACDVADTASVAAFAAAVSSPVDLLVNNAGVRIPPDDLATFDPADAARVLDVNALGALRVTIALLPLLRRASGARVVNVGSDLGSIEGNRSGGGYGYRMSKAALVMATRSLAHDLREAGIVAVVVSPGWVRTDMGGPQAPTSVEASVRGMLAVTDRLTPKDSGAFLDVRGQRIPW